MHSSNRDSGLGVRGSTALVLVLFVAFALVTNAQRGAGTPMWFEGARLIVGDGNTIDNAAFLVEGEAFTWVGKQGQRQPPQGALNCSSVMLSFTSMITPRATNKPRVAVVWIQLVK